MAEKKTMLYVQTSDDPERQYSPLVLAQTAQAMDLNAQVYYLGQGLRTLLPGAAEKIKLGSFPSVQEMINKTLEMGTSYLYSHCRMSNNLFSQLNQPLAHPLYSH